MSQIITHRCVSDLFVLDLQGRQAGLELREAKRELGLDLWLGGNLGHLTGSRTTTGQSGNHQTNIGLVGCLVGEMY